MWRAVAPEKGRLLRVLFVRLTEVSADTGRVAVLHGYPANNALIGLQSVDIIARQVSAYSVFRHYLLKPASPETILAIVEGACVRRRTSLAKKK